MKDSVGERSCPSSDLLRVVDVPLRQGMRLSGSLTRALRRSSHL